MTTPRQNRKIAQSAVAVIIMIGLAFLAKWYLGAHDAAPAQTAPPQTPTPSVVVDAAARADLAVAREYVGRVESIQTVDLMPQVAGALAGSHFKEGSAVRIGQLLFTLDNRQHQATVALRKADLAKAEAACDRAVKYLERLKAADSRSVSASDLDVAENDVRQGLAVIEQAKAALRLAEIDLGYTRITAPISGRIGKAAFTKGSYVVPSGSALASIVQTDPIRVAFSLPDRDYLEQLDAFKASGDSVYDATLRLSDGREYPAKGTRDFEDNMVDAKTGTIMMRVRFDNAEGLLIPGSMVRVGVKPAKSRVSVVIPQEAILADAQGDFVYGVDGNNVVHQRRVTLGAEAGSMREVLSGLDAGEKLVVRGLQSLRPEMTVNPVLRQADAAKTPAELAKESGDDVSVMPGTDASGDEKPAEEDR